MAGRQLSLDEKAIDDLLAKFWDSSRALRRFCLAFFRMHQELGGDAAGEDVIQTKS
jgi:hypothetical protein